MNYFVNYKIKKLNRSNQHSTSPTPLKSLLSASRLPHGHSEVLVKIAQCLHLTKPLPQLPEIDLAAAVDTVDSPASSLGFYTLSSFLPPRLLLRRPFCLAPVISPNSKHRSDPGLSLQTPFLPLLVWLVMSARLTASSHTYTPPTLSRISLAETSTLNSQTCLAQN